MDARPQQVAQGGRGPRAARRAQRASIRMGRELGRASAGLPQPQASDRDPRTARSPPVPGAGARKEPVNSSTNTLMPNAYGGRPLGAIAATFGTSARAAVRPTPRPDHLFCAKIVATNVGDVGLPPRSTGRGEPVRRGGRARPRRAAYRSRGAAGPQSGGRWVGGSGGRHAVRGGMVVPGIERCVTVVSSSGDRQAGSAPRVAR